MLGLVDIPKDTKWLRWGWQRFSTVVKIHSEPIDYSESPRYKTQKRDIFARKGHHLSFWRRESDRPHLCQVEGTRDGVVQGGTTRKREKSRTLSVVRSVTRSSHLPFSPFLRIHSRFDSSQENAIGSTLHIYTNGDNENHC